MSHVAEVPLILLGVVNAIAMASLRSVSLGLLAEAAENGLEHQDTLGSHQVSTHFE